MDRDGATEPALAVASSHDGHSGPDSIPSACEDHPLRDRRGKLGLRRSSVSPVAGFSSTQTSVPARSGSPTTVRRRTCTPCPPSTGTALRRMLTRGPSSAAGRITDASASRSVGVRTGRARTGRASVTRQARVVWFLRNSPLGHLAAQSSNQRRSFGREATAWAPCQRPPTASARVCSRACSRPRVKPLRPAR